MSNLVTALNGASSEGYVSVQEAPLTGMVTLRGEFDSAAFKKAVKEVTGCDVPAQRMISHQGDVSVGWMSPDELLVICAYEGTNDVVAKFTSLMGEEHSLAVNVSDARARFVVSGDRAREVIAKLAPVDMTAFEEGELRRTRFSQEAAAFWMSDAQTVNVVCFRSVAEYIFKLLSLSSETGFEVGDF